MRRLTLPLAATVLVATPSSAPAAERLVIKGAGFGHGIGMSQYGAYGFAKNGTGYRDILKHYYTDTQLTTLGQSPEVTVLLRAGSRSQTFSGATAITGRKALNPRRSYVVVPRKGGLAVKTTNGKLVLQSATAFRVRNGNGTNPTKLSGKGAYRGAMEFRLSFGGVTAINAVGLETYVRGVVSGESPASWPADALRAQAVAARTYALTSDAGTASDGFTQYDDIRSQVYGGVRMETPTTDKAIADTTGEIVTYQGRPVTTFFFSTSGGRTENIENSFIGAEPKPWLKSVEDPYDDASPKHRWELRLTLAQAQRKLGNFVKGKLRRIDVVKRGVSPRIVDAVVVGSQGRTNVTGPQLRARLGLNDTWATFTVIGATAQPEDVEPESNPGGVASAAKVRRHVLRGTIRPARKGAWVRVQQRRAGGSWTEIKRTVVESRGRYRATLPGRGTYRAVYGKVPSPSVTVR